MSATFPATTAAAVQPLDVAVPAEWTASVSAVGDLLLAGPTAVSRASTRSAGAAWQVEQAGEGWNLYAAAPTAGWRGAPLWRVDVPGWSAWLVGELYGLRDPAAAVAALLTGRTGAGALSGHFLLVAREHAGGRWHVWTNRHATLHAYRAEGATRALGTHFPAVAAAAGCRQLDWEGLAGFFACGFFVADRTHLEGARILRPATHLTFDAAGRPLAEERYWRWWREIDAGRSYDATVDEFGARFADVMGDLTADGRVAFPISGGLDSRATVATVTAAEAGNEQLWSFSYGYDDRSVETRIARQVAAARSLPFDAYAIRPYLFAQMPGVMAAVEGFEDVTQCRQAAVAAEIAAHSDFLIAAHLGDLFLDDMGLVDVDPLSLPDDDLAEVAWHKAQKRGSAWLLEHLVGPRMDPATAERRVRDAVADELQRIGDLGEPDYQIKAFKVDQWCARWTTVGLRMYQPAAFPRLPFYDARLLDFFATVPTSFVAGRRLQIDYLRRFAPDLARVTWQTSGRDLYHTGQRGPADLARRGLRKGWRALSGRRVPERNWEVQFLSPGGREALGDWLLRPGLRLHTYVDPAAVRGLLDAFYADPLAQKRGYTVSMLLTFSAWLEGQGGDLLA